MRAHSAGLRPPGRPWVGPRRLPACRASRRPRVARSPRAPPSPAGPRRARLSSFGNSASTDSSSIHGAHTSACSAKAHHGVVRHRPGNNPRARDSHDGLFNPRRHPAPPRHQASDHAACQADTTGLLGVVSSGFDPRRRDVGGHPRSRALRPGDDGDPEMTQVLLGARVFTGERILDGHAVVLEGERIVAVVPRNEAPVGLIPRTLPSDTLLVPGFIDLQVNGAGGVLFNESPTVDAALAIAATMRRTGTTGLLPTFITDAPDLTTRACEAASEAMAHPGGGVLGIHLEGPFISPERPGVHAPRYIRQPEPSDLEPLTALAAHLSRAGGRLLMTLAPEHVEDSFLRRLRDAGAVLFAGHTTASYERAMESVAAGVRGFTHLFNAMPPVQGRQPGPVQAGFSADEAWCSVIVDGHHVHPANLRQLLKAKPPGKVLLVTDAMPPVGTHEST